MEKVTVAAWDPAEIIETKEDVLAFLAGALDENDPDFLFETIGHIARSKGMALLARELDLDRAGLYKSFSAGGNPSFKTVYKLIDTLGFRLKLEPKTA
jgi:probable addiction module antidote protein